MQPFILKAGVIAPREEPWAAVTARLLLVVFGGMLIVPLLPASTLEAGLAICCRRSGKHLCIAQASSNLPGRPSVSEKCPYTIHHSGPARVSTLGLATASTQVL